MKFAPNLYYGEKAYEHRVLMKWRISHGLGVRDGYVLMLTAYGSDLMEIYPASAFKNRHFRRQPHFITGFALGHGEACELARRITEDALNGTGSLDLKSFFHQP